MKRNKFFLLIVLILSFIVLNAQDSNREERSNNRARKVIQQDSLSRQWVIFKVDSVLADSQDTMWVRLNGGTNAAIIEGSKGNAYSIYNSDDPDRGNLVLGSATHLSSEQDQSLCYVLLSDTTDPAKRIIAGDLVELPCLLPYREESFTMARIAQLGILFNDLDGNPLFTQLQMLYNTEMRLEDEIMAIMASDVYATWEFIKDMADDYPSWKEPMEGGKYDGFSMLDAMQNTTPSDVAAFLNFVLAFPGKYMGKTWKINETYATWLINATPLGDFDTRMLHKIHELENQELEGYISENTFYIQDSTLDKLNQYFNDYLNAYDLQQASAFNEKLVRISEILGNTSYRSIFLYNRGLIKIYREEWEESILDFKDAIDLDPENLNAYYYRGDAYAKLKDYYHAVKDYDRLTEALPDLALGYGNKGWYQILEGKIFDAMKNCKKAYELDSSTTSYALNLGHTYLLLGDTASAKLYYDRTLELLTSRADFHSGLADFDIFIENDWQTNHAREMREYMMKSYKDDYELYILSDSILDVGTSQSDAGEYEEALENLAKAYEYEQKSKNPRPYYLYVETSWIAYVYQQLKDFVNAEKYYRECLYYAYDVLRDDAKTANVYDLMAWNYDEWGKKTDYYTCKEKSLAYKQRYEEASKTRRLYLLAAGNNKFQDMEYKFADHDAETLARVLGDNPSNYYDSVASKVILSHELNLDKLEQAFRDIILDSRPDDIFIFYLGGTGVSDSGQFRLELPKNGTDTTTIPLEVNTIKTWLSSVQARNQFLVLDLFSPTFIDEFIGNYALSRGALATSNLNLGIISLSGHRLEDDSLKHGLLTHFIVESIQAKSYSPLATVNSVSIKKLNALMTDLNNQRDGILSWNTYYTGDDFVLVNHDSLDFSQARSRVAETSTRGVGSLSLKENEEFFLHEDGKNYALLFATNEYDEWDDLVNPIFDANALASTLSDFYGFQVELLTDNSRVDVLTKIREYQKRQYHPNDQLFIFFAGHGAYDEISGEGYIVCKDSKKDDEIRASYIAYSYLRENVNNIRSCNHILIALDVCFGGTFDKQVSKFARGSDDYSQINRDDFIKRAMRFKSRLFITSGSKEYVSDGDPGKHSPFAYRILDVLRSQGMINGYVTFNLLVQSVERLQTTPRYGDFGDNEPGSEFIFSIENDAPQRAFKVADLK